MNKKLVTLYTVLGSGGGVGYFPIAPGTVGSLLALLIWWIATPRTSLAFALIIVFFLAGLAASNVLEQLWGPDPGKIVIDEMVGMWVGLLGVPPSLLLVGCAFFLFRVFDIIKPPPCRLLERYAGGWGVMLDDIGAGMYTLICMQMIIYWFR